MTDTKATDEPKPLVYHHAFLAAAATPPVPILAPAEDQEPVRVQAPALGPATLPASQPSSMAITFDTGATAHMVGNRSGMSTYTSTQPTLIHDG